MGSVLISVTGIIVFRVNFVKIHVNFNISCKYISSSHEINKPTKIIPVYILYVLFSLGKYLTLQEYSEKMEEIGISSNVAPCRKLHIA
jgi:hypothetical protein